MKSTSYVLGFLCGLLAVAVIGLLLRFIFRKKPGFFGNKYDERQMAVQGVGYKYGFYALLIALVLGGVIENFAGRQLMTLMSFAVVCLWVGLTVFIAYCIRFDAYIAINAKRKPLLIAFVIAAVINLFLFAINVSRDGLTNADGILNDCFGNLVTGAALLILCIVLVIREIRERRSEQDA